MQFSPYRVQLAGVRTALAEPRALSYEIPVAGVLTSVSESGGSETQPAALEFLVAISRDDVPLLKKPQPAMVWSAANRAAQRDGIAHQRRSRKHETGG
jgi:hypothetical protein